MVKGRRVSSRLKLALVVPGSGLVKAQADLDLARSRQRRDAELLAQGYVSAAVLDASNAALSSAAAGVRYLSATAFTTSWLPKMRA